MAEGHPAPGRLTLEDRRNESAVLDGLLAAVRAGRSGALVLRGEPGIGKTALLEYAIGSSSDMRVLRAVGGGGGDGASVRGAASVVRSDA